MNFNSYLLVPFFVLGSFHVSSAQVDEDQMGAWYMYFFNTNFGESQWGIQGDVQYRDFALAGDLQQLMLRSGVTFIPENTKVKLTLGYANITTGTFGDETATIGESRIYQEALLPIKIGERVYTNHRYRYEQRFVEGQDFRTRYRYNLFLNVPINNAEMVAKTFYIALYNELFINGQKEIGEGQRVEFFDRNRFYSALGYVVRKGLNVQLGIMNQSSNAVSKNQLQFSLHHTF